MSSSKTDVLHESLPKLVRIRVETESSSSDIDSMFLDGSVSKTVSLRLRSRWIRISVEYVIVYGHGS